MNKDELNYHVLNTQVFVGMLESSIGLNNAQLALRVLDKVQKELDGIRHVLEVRISMDAKISKPSQ